MRYPNWAQVYANDPDIESYDKNQEDIINLTIDSISPEACIQNFQNEPNLISISVTPITNEIQVLHHLTTIGGNISDPQKKLVALTGFDSEARAVMLDPKLFEFANNVEIPTWTNLSKAKDKKELLGCILSRSTLKFRSIINIPPLLAKCFINKSSGAPEDLFFDCVAAIKAFDSTHKESTEFPSADKHCRRILFFIWAAAVKKIKETIVVSSDNCHLKKFQNDLHHHSILSKSVLNPDSSSAITPSDSTLNSLAGSISSLTNHLESAKDEKNLSNDSKLNKFDKLPEFSKKTILHASARSKESERMTVNDDFNKLLQQNSLSRARTHLNQTLASYKCNIDACAILVATIMAGDLIWTRSSHTPEKFTIFLMGKPNPKRQSMSQKDWLKLHLQEADGQNGLDDKMIEKLAHFNYDYPIGLADLRHFINNMTGCSRLMFYPTSAASLSLVSWIDHIDDNELIYEMQFDIDSLFGLKICLTIDRGMQLFLQSCQDASNINGVNFTYLDFSFDQNSIERGRFTCNPPPPLLALFSDTKKSDNNEDTRQGKSRRKNALSGIGQDEDKESNLIQMDNKNDKWILNKDEDYRKVFNKEIWKENPPPIINKSKNVVTQELSAKDSVTTIAKEAMRNQTNTQKPNTTISKRNADNLQISNRQ